jgi:hypothetical protein
LAKHTYFKELCAMAPMDLSPSEREELTAHLQDCEECSRAVTEYEHLYEQIVPATKRQNDAYIESRRDEMRNYVLRNISTIDSESSTTKTYLQWMPSRLGTPKLALSYFAAAVLIAVVAFRAGAHSARQVLHPTSAQNLSTGGNTSNHPVAESTSPISNKSTPDARPLDTGFAEAKSSDLAIALNVEREHSAELARAISSQDNDLKQAIEAQHVLRAQVDTQAKALNETEGELHDAQSKLGQAQATNSSATGSLVDLQNQVQTLTQKLNVQTASLERERGLLAHGSEIRDIVGARNLHIIDVYDTDADGDTTRPFARAFYTEHKSLVYYAYDLPPHRSTDGKFSYVAWAQSNGTKKTVKRIGMLFNDDQAQKRWTLNLTDPDALADISSVFITLERTDEDVDHPKGRRMLTAYLGTEANHP